MIARFLDKLPWRRRVNRELNTLTGEVLALRRLFTSTTEDLAATVRKERELTNTSVGQTVVVVKILDDLNKLTEEVGRLRVENDQLREQLRNVTAEVRQISVWRERVKRAVAS